MLNPGCDRIPIESLEWDNPECVFVMVLALAGSYHDHHDHGDYHYLDNHNPKCVFVIVEQVIIITMIKVHFTMTKHDY